MRGRPALATAAWVATSLPADRSFRRALADPAAAQARLLQEIVSAARGSAFAREHGLDKVDSVEAFRRAVPPRDYDGHAPWIARVAKGEAAVLTGPGDPITRFEPSSGSTAAAKLIPSTQRLRAHFQRAIAPWVVDLYRQHPRLLGGPSYWAVSPLIRHPATPGGLPVGFEEDGAYLGALGQRLVDHAMAVPGAVSQLEDMEVWRYATLLFLLRAEGLRLISVWNPSFLTLLLAPMAERWDALLSDLFTGARLGPVELPPAPRRAEALSALDPTDLHGIWPELGLVSCWADAHARAHLPPLRARLPQAAIHPKGLLATEAVLSIPYQGAFPVALRSAFIELEGEDGVLRGVDEWRQGEVGSCAVTTAGGLYRYRLRDRVEVTGYLGRTPTLRFLGKEDRVSDRCGEKLNEAFVASVLGALGLAEGFAMLAPETESAEGAADGPGAARGEPRVRYRLYTDQPVSPGLAARLQAALEDNPHYRWCCELGQLAPVEVARVSGDANSAYIEACRRGGQRLGDIKPCVLSPRSGWSQTFQTDAELS